LAGDAVFAPVAAAKQIFGMAGGQRRPEMSKSLAISSTFPNCAVDRDYSLDALRYYLLRVAVCSDMDFNDVDFNKSFMNWPTSWQLPERPSK